MTFFFQSESKQARNEEICRLYISGLTLKECGDKYGISKERTRQIVREAIERRAQELVIAEAKSLTKARREAKAEFKWKREPNVEKSDRDEFLGVNLSEEDKTALKQEAERRGISMSMLTSDLIKEMLASRNILPIDS